MRPEAQKLPGPIGAAGVAVLAGVLLAACQPSGSPGAASAPKRDAQTTVLPTRQTTIDPVSRKLDAAQQETERRRTEIDAAAK
jgi:hypothetical protein